MLKENLQVMPKPVFQICPQCQRQFPSDLIAPMIAEESSILMCPLCALKKRNEVHPSLKDTPFQGKIANDMWERANAIYKKRK